MVVLEELDSFKKGVGSINFQARDFIRILAELSATAMLNGGVSLGEGKGTLAIKLDSDIARSIESLFRTSKKNDNYILNLAKISQGKCPNHQIILVSKDVHLRMKAETLGIKAEDYTSDKVSNIDGLYKGFRYIDNVEHDVIEMLVSGDMQIPSTILGTDFCQNEYVVASNGSSFSLGKYVKYDNTIRTVCPKTAYGISPNNVEQSFVLDALMDPSIPLVTISGKAGTGKTLLALAASLEIKERYRHILITRPIIALSNKDIGFLPGDIESKVKPYMESLFDNLRVIRNQFGERSKERKKLQKVIEDGKLEITPLTFIRGRTFVKDYMIIDEAQNLTPNEIKTAITRAGVGTKIVLTGDINQIDHPYLDIRSNGLSYLIDRMQVQEMYAHIDLQKGERSALAELASNIL